MEQEYMYMHVYQYQKIKRVKEKLIAIKLNEFGYFREISNQLTSLPI